MQIILQGPLLPETAEIAQRYLAEDFISSIIVSCWHGEDVSPFAGLPGIEVVQSQVPELCGPGNINLQITTSAAGVARLRSDLAAKMRSDQAIAGSSLRMMREFCERHDSVSAEGPGPRGPLFTTGAYRELPCHPQDHVFWGYRQDLQALFSLPLCTDGRPDPEHPADLDYRDSFRANMYLGAHYHARFDADAVRMVSQPHLYLYDGSPRRHEALAMARRWGDRLFKTFPRVEMFWHQRDWGSYAFDLGQLCGESWHDAPW